MTYMNTGARARPKSGGRGWLAVAILIAITAVLAGAAEAEGQGNVGEAPTVVVSAASGDSVRVDIELASRAGGEALSSYQGVIRFDPAVLRPGRAEFPPETLGGWNEGTPGALRFAAAAPAGTDRDTVLTVYFSASRSIGASDFNLSFDGWTLDAPASMALRAAPAPRRAGHTSR